MLNDRNWKKMIAEQCITNGMTWVDWTLTIIFQALGLWKSINLIDVYAPKLANYIIKRIEGATAKGDE